MEVWGLNFLADHMLGRLARWLRILGFDVEYAGPIATDNEIINICKKRGLTLLTRDKELFSRYSPSMYIEAHAYREQIRQFAGVHHPDPMLLFSRCPLCNSLLILRNRENAVGMVPEGIYERFSAFSYCDKCDKYYWEGDHYTKMLESLREMGVMT